MEHKLFFLPDKPEPEDHGEITPYDLTNHFPLGTQALYPTGRVYMLQQCDYLTTTGLKYQWAGIAKGEGHKLSSHLKMYALLEGITLRV